MAHYSSDNTDIDNVEEGIDANEFILEHDCSFNLNASTNQEITSPQDDPENLTSNSNYQICDNLNSAPNLPSFQSNSLNDALISKQAEILQGPRNNISISSSYPSIKDFACSSDETTLPSTCSLKVCSQSLPSLVELNCTSVHQTYHPQAPSSNRSPSSTTSLSSSHSQPIFQFTVSTSTNVNEGYDHLPTIFFPHNDSLNPTSYFAHSMMPISESSSATRNLLLPPTWIPDELVNTCSLCAQVFNLIRRRHHCRRCGNIFCHQCSNNYISLKCFGYAKPVRVCNRCLVMHEQQSLDQPVPPDSTSTTSYGA